MEHSLCVTRIANAATLSVSHTMGPVRPAPRLANSQARHVFHKRPSSSRRSEPSEDENASNVSCPSLLFLCFFFLSRLLQWRSRKGKNRSIPSLVRGISRKRSIVFLWFSSTIMLLRMIFVELFFGYI